MTDDERATIAAERRRLLDQAESGINGLRVAAEAQRAVRAKLYPERPLAKVLEFKPRSA